MRCPDCSKFVSMDMSYPELESNLEFDTEMQTVTGTVRIERNCAECGTPLKEGQLDAEHVAASKRIGWSQRWVRD